MVIRSFNSILYLIFRNLLHIFSSHRKGKVSYFLEKEPPSNCLPVIMMILRKGKAGALPSFTTMTYMSLGTRFPTPRLSTSGLFPCDL